MIKSVLGSDLFCLCAPTTYKTVFMSSGKRHLLLFLVSLQLFWSCNTNTQQESNKPTSSSVLPSNTGKEGELVLIISDQLWQGEAGSFIRSVFQEPLKGLSQNEALYDLYQIESRDFSNIFKTHKNILWISLDKQDSIVEEASKWAKDQQFVNIRAANNVTLINLLHTHLHQIRDVFYERDNKRRLSKLKTKSNKELEDQVLDAYNIDILIPKGYQVAVSEPNFIWLRRDAPTVNIISNLWIYQEDYKSAYQLSKEGLLARRDSIGRVHVEGAAPQSYMSTERLYNPDFYVLSQEPYIIEARGLWTMVNDFLGGSFICRSHLDTSTKTLITVEGFLYSPNERKRTHIQELEAIISSARRQ